MADAEHRSLPDRLVARHREQYTEFYFLIIAGLMGVVPVGRCRNENEQANCKAQRDKEKPSTTVKTENSFCPKTSVQKISPEIALVFVTNVNRSANVQWF